MPSGQISADNRLLQKSVNTTIRHNSEDRVSLSGLFILCLLFTVTIFKRNTYVKETVPLLLGPLHFTRYWAYIQGQLKP
jgi:hypothetical protein